MQMELNAKLNELTAKVYIEHFVAQVSQAGSLLVAKVEFLKNAEKSEVLNTNVLTRYDEYDNGNKRSVTSNMIVVPEHNMEDNEVIYNVTVVVTVTSKNDEPVTLTRTIKRK